MMCTDKNKAYFFNYFIFDGIEYWHEIIVERDEEVCNLMIMRIAEANRIKEEYIEKLNKNKQF